MAKYELRIQARNLRRKGESVKVISQNLNISKSTVSLWVRDIILSIDQLEKLKNRRIEGSERGRLKSAFLQKERRLKLQKESKQEGINYLKKLSNRELLIAGIALYWAEGSKKKREISFCNSDPQLINFMIEWLENCFFITKNNLKAVVGINEIHKNREKIVKDYWSRTTQIPLSQFNQTSFKKTKNKKIYDNFDDHYGTLSIKVLKPGVFYYKIIGLIEALSIMPG